MSTIVNAKLALEDGTIFHGKALGTGAKTGGELCFNTGMTGYQEVFTDPSYYGQLLVMTNVHIGNYGVARADEESSKVQIAGLICRDYNIKEYRHMADEDIQTYLHAQGISGIYDIDTRALVKHIREQGAMNAVISSEDVSDDSLIEEAKNWPKMKGLELASTVSTKEVYYEGNPDASMRIAVMDFGVKRNMLKCLAERDCYLSVFPAQTEFEAIKAWNPDAVLLSNGPGDPASMPYAVATTKSILEANIPTFGICLGHQILALANGIGTYKMKHGHRGINHPVKNLRTGKCEITSQNHGFGVRAEDLEKNMDLIEITHINLNDQTVEGIKLKHKPAFSVQYHPEASPGPHDAMYLFDDFINLIKQSK